MGLGKEGLEHVMGRGRQAIQVWKWQRMVQEPEGHSAAWQQGQDIDMS